MLRLAVTARTVELAEVADEEVGDSQCSAAVVLKDFVFCALCTAADDAGGAGSLLDGECI